MTSYREFDSSVVTKDLVVEVDGCDTRAVFAAGGPAVDPDPAVTIMPLGRPREAVTASLDLESLERLRDWATEVLVVADYERFEVTP